MQVIRGRMGQYKSLVQNEPLRPYVMTTERFSQNTLFSMIENVQQVILKPIVGADFIVVKKQDAMYVVKTKLETIEVLEENLYETIQQIIGNKKYVIQRHSDTKQSFRRLITVQKRHDGWFVSASTKQTASPAQTIAYLMQRRKLKNLALLAAEQLGTFYPLCETVVVEEAFTRLGEIAITDSFLHFSVSKWNQYQRIAKYMPKTELLTPATFHRFLRSYRLVFLKPCNGQQGKGIIKIRKIARRGYEVQMGRQKWIIQGIEQLYAKLCQLYPIEDYYIIQRGIALATINQHVSDIRVMTQKVEHTWQVTGKVVKVAGPHFFVTNAAQMVLPLQQAFKQSTVLLLFQRRLDRRINRLCLAASKVLDEPIARIIIGFDVAVTNLGRLTILEGNYVPDLSFFHKLEDQSMYHTILKIKRRSG